MARWRVVLTLDGEWPDAHAARMEGFRVHGGRLVRVVSVASDEIGEEEARTAKRQRRRLFDDSDQEGE